jgi:hypothetical protein
MSHKSFEDIGIPPGYGFKRLLFNPPTQTIIVHVEAVRHWRPERLYLRSVASERYTAIGSPGDMISQECPVTSNSQPLLAYIAIRHKFDVDAGGEERHSGNWESLNLVNLMDGTDRSMVDFRTIGFPTEVTRGWVASLLSFGSGPHLLHVVCALQKSES